MQRHRLATATMLATAITLAPLFAAAQSAEPPTNLSVARVRHIQPAGAAEVDLTWWWFREQGPDAVGFTIQWKQAENATTCGSFQNPPPSTNTHYEAGGNKRAAAIEPLNRAKAYCFRIRTDAANTNLDSGWSPPTGPVDLQEETDLGSLPEPTVSVAGVGHNQVQLTVGAGSCEPVGNTRWEYAWRDVLDDWEDIPSRSGRLSTLDGRADGDQTVTVNMTNGRNYVFRVRYHCDADGDDENTKYSSWSFESEIVTPTTRFPAPTGLRAVGGNSSCRLSWNRPATPPRSYDLERRGYPAPEEGTHNWVASGSPAGSAASHTVQGLSDGTQYEFRIRAVVEDGESDWSESAVCETLGGFANDPPEALGTLGPFTLQVGTTMPIEVSDYFRDPDGDDLEYSARSSNRTFVGVSGSGSSFTLSGAAIGSAQVSVTATDPAGESAEQTAEVTVVEEPTPGPPTNVTLVANDTTLTLSWDEPANHRDFSSIAYEVQFRRDGGPWSTAGVAIDGTSATLTGIRGSSYRARVLAKSGDAKSSWAPAGPVTISDAPLPGLPTSVVGFLDGRYPAVAWEPPLENPDAVKGYAVQYRVDDPVWIDVPGCTALPSTARTCKLSTPASGDAEYSFRVRAKPGAGWSPPATVSAIRADAPVIHAPELLDDDVVRITWNAPLNAEAAGVTAYEVALWRYRPDNSEWEPSASANSRVGVEVLAKSYMPDVIPAGCLFSVRVRAVGQTGPGPYARRGPERNGDPPCSDRLPAAPLRLKLQWQGPFERSTWTRPGLLTWSQPKGPGKDAILWNIRVQRGGAVVLNRSVSERRFSWNFAPPDFEVVVRGVNEDDDQGPWSDPLTVSLALPQPDVVGMAEAKIGPPATRCRPYNAVVTGSVTAVLPAPVPAGAEVLVELESIPYEDIYFIPVGSDTAVGVIRSGDVSTRFSASPSCRLKEGDVVQVVVASARVRFTGRDAPTSYQVTPHPVRLRIELGAAGAVGTGTPVPAFPGVAALLLGAALTVMGAARRRRLRGAVCGDGR